VLRREFTFLLAAILLSLPLLAATAAAQDQCTSCPARTEFYAEYRKLYDYYQRWQGSPHQQAGVSCADCHGGDPAATDADEAHAGVRPMNDASSTLARRAQPDTCGQCHRANRNQFLQSKHFAALMDDRAAPTCTTCHPAMSSRPELRTIVADACSTCHAPGNENDLPLITEQATRVFQQLNIAAGLLGWTRIHFESHGWPDDSRNRVNQMTNRYEDVLSQVHAFRLDDTEAATIELMGNLREIFDNARREYEERAAEPENRL